MVKIVGLAFILIGLLIGATPVSAHPCHETASPAAMVMNRHAGQPMGKQAPCEHSSRHSACSCAACCLAMPPPPTADIAPIRSRASFGVISLGIQHAWIAPAEAEPPRPRA